MYEFTKHEIRQNTPVFTLDHLLHPGPPEYACTCNHRPAWTASELQLSSWGGGERSNSRAGPVAPRRKGV